MLTPLKPLVLATTKSFITGGRNRHYIRHLLSLTYIHARELLGVPLAKPWHPLRSPLGLQLFLSSLVCLCTGILSTLPFTISFSSIDSPIAHTRLACSLPYILAIYFTLYLTEVLQNALYYFNIFSSQKWWDGRGRLWRQVQVILHILGSARSVGSNPTPIILLYYCIY